jgi:glycosyltransferase involved in cell wall biosynthesis
MKAPIRILVLTKRQYTNKDLIDDRFGRLREIPFELSRLGHEVNGICLSYKRKKEGFFNDRNVCWRSINAGKLKIIGLCRFIREAIKLSNSADLIWACSDSFFGIIGYVLSQKFRIPLIFDLYDNFDYFFAAKLPIVKQFYHRAIRNSTAISCVSSQLADLVKNSYGKKQGVFKIENAVRRDLFRPIELSKCRNLLKLPQEGVLIGTAGALTQNRGIDILFDAFFKLITIHPDLHLVIAGPRDVAIPSDKRIHDLGTLPLEKVPQLFNALDVAVVCVKDDDFGKYCFPQKVVEIMACDVPLVAANVGSLKEIFADSPNWLFEPGNIDSLEMAIENRLHDRRTDYKNAPTWNDMAKVFHSVMISVLKDCQANAPNDRE